MSENSQSKDNQERQFNEKQFQILLRCSEKGDVSEWNEWCVTKGQDQILLKKAGFSQKNRHG